MRVNFGCGEQYADGWVNVDHDGSPHRKDVTLDIRDPLPWKNEVRYAYLGHVLEHLYVDEVIAFLLRLHNAMPVDGEVMVVGPDVLRAEKLMAEGYELSVPFESIRHGADRWHGDVHHWDCTSAAVRQLLFVTGWKDILEVGIDNVPAVWPVAFRGPQWQCAVSARQSGDNASH